MYADARISPARINWRQGSGYKKTHRRIYGYMFRFDREYLAHTITVCARYSRSNRLNRENRMCPDPCSVRVLSEPHRVIVA